MLKNMRAPLFLAALGILGGALIACSAGTVSPGTGTGSTATPQQQIETTSPTSGLKVSGTIASVTLGEECGPSCGSSNVQIAFNAGAGSKGATVEIVNVTLVDSASGERVDTLNARRPQVWNGNGYAQWNQSVTPGGDLKASYDLSSPAWSTIEGNGAESRTSSSYSRSFKLNVTLRIDGVEVILQSVDLNRQPVSVT